MTDARLDSPNIDADAKKPTGTKLIATAWQTVGPFFSLGLAPGYLRGIAGPDAVGQRIVINGQIFDGDGAPVPDAIIEIWQANAHGKYAHPDDPQEKPLDPNFLGHGRIPTNEEGHFSFTTIKPGSVDSGTNQPQAPHLSVSLMMRGLLRRLTTRIYFPNEPLNITDPILQLVDPQRQKTLLLTAQPDARQHFLWNINLQGADETVFFEF
jgi:protocatechuate 3,4-dioxygenase, alpha subunit